MTPGVQRERRPRVSLWYGSGHTATSASQDSSRVVIAGVLRLPEEYIHIKDKGLCSVATFLFALPTPKGLCPFRPRLGKHCPLVASRPQQLASFRLPSGYYPEQLHCFVRRNDPLLPSAGHTHLEMGTSKSQ